MALEGTAQVFEGRVIFHQFHPRALGDDLHLENRERLVRYLGRSRQKGFTDQFNFLNSFGYRDIFHHNSPEIHAPPRSERLGWIHCSVGFKWRSTLRHCSIARASTAASLTKHLSISSRSDSLSDLINRESVSG